MKRSNFTYKQRLYIFKRDDMKCFYCLKELGKDYTPTLTFKQIEIDHIIPCKEGGTNIEKNGRVSCREHNRKFGSRVDK